MTITSNDSMDAGGGLGTIAGFAGFFAIVLYVKQQVSGRFQAFFDGD